MFGAGYLTEFALPKKVADHSTAATGDVSCDAVDMAEDGGYDGVLLVTSYGTTATNNILKASGSADNSTFAEFDSTCQIASNDGTYSNEDVMLDIQRPTTRYVKAVPERGTSTTLESVWAIRYRSRSRPVTDVVAGTAAIVRVASPGNA